MQGHNVLPMCLVVHLRSGAQHSDVILQSQDACRQKSAVVTKINSKIADYSVILTCGIAISIDISSDVVVAIGVDL